MGSSPTTRALVGVRFTREDLFSSKVETRTLKGCQHPQRPGDRFCPQCGAKPRESSCTFLAPRAAWLKNLFERRSGEPDSEGYYWPGEAFEVLLEGSLGELSFFFAVHAAPAASVYTLGVSLWEAAPSHQDFLHCLDDETVQANKALVAKNLEKLGIPGTPETYIWNHIA